MSIDEGLEHLTVLGDQRVIDVLTRCYLDEAIAYERNPEQLDRWDDDCEDPFLWSSFAFPVRAPQAAELYSLARVARVTTVVEFATSHGFGTLALAAAVRDNGGGTVITAELVPAKAEAARVNLAAAGLEAFVEVRIGDARRTLADLAPSSADLLVLDGWPTGQVPSVDVQVLDLVRPALRSGALVFDDNGEDDVIAALGDRSLGFRTLAGGTAHGTVALFDPSS